MPRLQTVRVALLSLLLVFMQQAAQWHALDHLGEWLKRPHEQALLVPASDAPCAVCALFAGGAAAAPNEPAIVPATPVTAGVTHLAPSALATAAPSSYLIRAPPVLL